MAVGVWTAQFDFHPAALVRDACQELEELGYGSLWIGENVGREPFTQAGLILAATSRLQVATGVVNIWARDPLATLAAQYTLSEAFLNRFVLGVGVSHRHLVETVRGHRYQQPLRAMTTYLDAMQQAADRYRAVRPADTRMLLAALGPRMLELAATRTDGAHTYLVPPEHTAIARAALGAGSRLVVEQAIVLDADDTRGRHTARRHIRRYLPLPNYVRNLRRLGYTDADLTDDGSNRLVETLVAIGDEEAVADRIRQHLDAGADDVCIQVLDPDLRALPLPQWRRMADAGIPAINRTGSP